jgi:hypothetical protein
MKAAHTQKQDDESMWNNWSRTGIGRGNRSIRRQSTPVPSHIIGQAVRRWIPTVVARVRIWSGHVGFVGGQKVALGQVFSEYFDFPCQ